MEIGHAALARLKGRVAARARGLRGISGWKIFATNCRGGAAACLLFLLLGTVDVSATDPRRVLLLHAFGHAYSPWSDMAGRFRSELIGKSPEPISLFEVSLDTARTEDPQDEGPFVAYIRALLAERAPDLV